ncbi:MAG: hypothetical protein HC806_01245 [Anaerolineae bacterium]|nr:hypothetical protein [Anaerolineae bacterium]
MARRLTLFITTLFFVFAAIIRLTDLSDQPLDFNPTRQLRAMVIARGIYYAGLTDIDPATQKPPSISKNRCRYTNLRF